MPRLLALLASEYAGDALNAVVIHTLVAPMLPEAKPWVTAPTAGTGWMIEIPATLRPLLGSTFNPPDRFCHTAGSATTRTAHTLWLRRTRTG